MAMRVLGATTPVPRRGSPSRREEGSSAGRGGLLGGSRLEGGGGPSVNAREDNEWRMGRVSGGVRRTGDAAQRRHGRANAILVDVRDGWEERRASLRTFC